MGAPTGSEVLIAALEAVARAGTYRPTARPESHLVRAVREALTGHATVIAGEPRYELRGWTRRPGGVDLAFEQRRRSLVECKVDKPDESLWDALKLADIAQAHRVRAAFLLYDATDAIWRSHPVAPLFTAASEPSIRELIERWPAAWGNLLFGGKGIRPRESVSRLRLEPLAAVALAPGRVARLLGVAPAGGVEHFDEDGWPVGYEPPAGLRERSRYRGPGGIAPGDEIDVCHGYPWYRRFTQERLAQVVPTLDDEAYACLRKRLAAEKHWTQPELRERVDPLRNHP